MRHSGAFQIHIFETTGEAYDASQTDDSIRSGDLLVATRERAVAVLFKAWPVAIPGLYTTPGAWHEAEPGFDWEPLPAANAARALFHAWIHRDEEPSATPPEPQWDERWVYWET